MRKAEWEHLGTLQRYNNYLRSEVRSLSGELRRSLADMRALRKETKKAKDRLITVANMKRMPSDSAFALGWNHAMKYMATVIEEELR